MIDADQAFVEFTEHSLPVGIDEAPGDNADCAASAVVLDLFGCRNLELDDMRVGRAGTEREYRFVAAPDPFELVADDRLGPERGG